MTPQLSFKSTYLLILLIVLAHFAPSLADAKSKSRTRVEQRHGGSAGGGGGTSCSSAAINFGMPVLLDLALAASSDFADPDTLSDQLPLPKSLQVIQIENTLAYKNAVTVIEQWRDPVTPTNDKLQRNRLAKSLLHAMDALGFVGTRCPLPYIVRAAITNPAKCSHTTGVVHYNVFLGILSIPAWNNFGFKSKTALIIHEALRRFQISNRLGGNDSDLQNLTSLLYEGPISSTKISQVLNHRFLEKYWKIPDFMFDSLNTTARPRIRFAMDYINENIDRDVEIVNYLKSDYANCQ